MDLLHRVAAFLHQTPQPTSQESGSLILNELMQLSSAQTQIRNDSANTFYVFLVLATILVTGLVPSIGLYFDLRSVRFSPYVVEALIALILIAASVLSWYFLHRLIQFSKEYAACTTQLEAIKRFYISQLTPPSAQIEGLIFPQPTPRHVVENPKTVSRYMRYTIVLVGSFCSAMAAFIVFGFLSFRAIKLYGIPAAWIYPLATAVALAICVGLLFCFRKKYFFTHVSRKEKIIRWMFLVLLGGFIPWSIVYVLGSWLFPQLTDNGQKAYSMIIPYPILAFFLSLLVYWLLYCRATDEFDQGDK